MQMCRQEIDQHVQDLKHSVNRITRLSMIDIHHTDDNGNAFLPSQWMDDEQSPSGGDEDDEVFHRWRQFCNVHEKRILANEWKPETLETRDFFFVWNQLPYRILFVMLILSLLISTKGGGCFVSNYIRFTISWLHRLADISAEKPFGLSPVLKYLPMPFV